VETADTITDAFGGALGAEKSVVANDLRLTVDCAPGVSIQGIFSGNYEHSIRVSLTTI
jgi:hypothetical protein